MKIHGIALILCLVGWVFTSSAFCDSEKPRPIPRFTPGLKFSKKDSSPSLYLLMRPARGPGFPPRFRIDPETWPTEPMSSEGFQPTKPELPEGQEKERFFEFKEPNPPPSPKEPTPLIEPGSIENRVSLSRERVRTQAQKPIIAGSDQPSSEEYFFLAQNKFKGKTIQVVDLRQESHAFMNKNLVVWFSPYNTRNAAKKSEAIQADEKERIRKLQKQKTVIAYLYTKDQQPDPSQWDLTPLSFENSSIQTEAEILEEVNLRLRQDPALHKTQYEYLRIAIPDHQRPMDEEVDRLKDLILSHKEVLYFHCAGGYGRTTTALVIANLLNHFQTIQDLETILKKQFLLGGSQLEVKKKDPTDKKDSKKRSWAHEREDFLRHFFKYCQENGPLGFPLSWKAWIQMHPLASKKRSF